MNDPDTFLCKIIVIGDQAVGKTSILSKFISNKFSDMYHETIGVDFLTKQVTLNEQRRLKCQFWDASGAEKYRTIVSAYFKGANGIVAVFDVTSRDSFESIKDQLECYRNHVGVCGDLTVMVIGNKSDLGKRLRTFAGYSVKFLKN